MNIMQQNAYDLLQISFKQFCQTTFPEVIDGDEFKVPNQNLGRPFEFFSIERYMSQFNINSQDLDAGMIGQSDSGKDGGIDGCYLVYDGSVIPRDEDMEYQKSTEKRELKLILIQSKYREGVTENAINKLHSAYRMIIQGKDPQKLREFRNCDYSDDLLDFIEFFHKELLQTQNFTFTLEMVLASGKVLPEDLDDSMNQKAQNILKTVQADFGKENSKFTFVIADACKLNSLEQKISLQLNLQLNQLIDSNGYIGLCSLSDFYNFISLDDRFRDDLFSMNVRDFQNNTEINRGIKKTLTEKLQDSSPEGKQNTNDDFWWFNNGITIVCDEINPKSNRLLSMKNPQIVNGMQTSRTIHDVFHDNPQLSNSKTKQILIRIIQADLFKRDQIIRATNSQNAIDNVVLSATDPQQINIEKYLNSKGWYYERRKNEYKNKGNINRKKIKQVKELAQITYAMLGHPNTAWSAPASIFRDKENANSIYKKVFPDTISNDLYDIILRIDESIVQQLNQQESSKKSWRFALDSLIVSRKLGHAPKDLNEMLRRKTELAVEENDISNGISEIETLLDIELARLSDKTTSVPSILKSKEFTDKLLNTNN